MTAKDKIAYMHARFGERVGEKCKDCQHCLRCKIGNKVLRKCEVYGVSLSEATDWRASNTACGLFNVDTEYRAIYKERGRVPRVEEPLSEQIGIEV